MERAVVATGRFPNLRRHNGTRIAAGLMVLLTACGTSENNASDSSPSTTTSSSPTTSSLSSTTTTDSPDIRIGNAVTRWIAGNRYRADSFLVPLSFTVDSEGWRSTGATGSGIDIGLDADGDGSIDATLTLFAYLPDDAPDDVLNAIVDLIERKSNDAGSSPPSLAMIQTGDAPVADLTTSEAPRRVDRRCSRPEVPLVSDGPGFFLIDQFPDPVSYGIPSCATSRLWLLPLSGQTITAVGIAVDPDRFAELMQTFDSFLATNMTVER